MAMYLGTPGRMVELKSAAAQRRTRAERVAFEETAEGNVFGQTRPVGRRTWDVTLPAATTPYELAQIEAFVDGDWGIGPWAFLPVDALVTNTLTPDTAACRAGTIVKGTGLSTVAPGGSMVLPDGRRSPRSWSKTQDGALYFGLNASPVLPGKVVTASAYVQGAAGAAGVIFYDALGGTVKSIESAVMSSAAVPVRSFLTTTVPAGAVSARVFVNAAATLTTWPALTWTGSLLEYGAGRGCDYAQLTGFSDDLLMAIANPKFGRYSSASFMIREVG
ncbi:hypothetical protein [Zhihengliuella sp.]|uniref:hypothetical protein n=1 Tax=Zhihengliuella sp. TaxID=1954483 RepID=UPI002810B951|nr:hypothetical protein [Zhihengliuella sp.]